MDPITVLFKRIPTAGLLSLAAMTMLSVCPASASSVSTYNSSVSFLHALQPGSYLNTFDGLALGATPSGSLNASSGVYHYQVDVSGDSVYVISDATNAANHELSTASANYSMTFTFENPINAVGANFFLTDAPGNVTPGNLTITLADGTQANLTDPAGTNFNGFIAIGSTISKLTVSPGNTGAYATVDNLYTGQAAVPEPQSIYLLLSGLGTCALGLYRRKA